MGRAAVESKRKPSLVPHAAKLDKVEHRELQRRLAKDRQREGVVVGDGCLPRTGSTEA